MSTPAAALIGALTALLLVPGLAAGAQPPPPRSAAADPTRPDTDEPDADEPDADVGAEDSELSATPAPAPAAEAELEPVPGPTVELGANANAGEAGDTDATAEHQAKDAPAPAPEPAAPPSDRGLNPHDPNTPPGYSQGFHFGSYGRVVTGGDATGRPIRNADIVAFGSRLDESTYAELEVRREDYWEATDSYTRMVMTLAMANPVFHYTGNFDVTMAIRNLYLESADLGVKGLRIWMGSRMYRGDDIYLLNFWPLDNLNTVGGGVGYYFKTRTSLKLHAGLNQPHSGWFKQGIDRPLPLNQLGATEVALLDRQKGIASAKLDHVFAIGDGGGIKATGYGELHWTGAGQREIADQIYEELPADKGFVTGAQVSAFTGKRSTHLNLIARYAGGLGAYGEFNAPYQLNLERTSKGARELLFAASGNYERGPFGVMLGAYYRLFRDASPALDYHDLNEGIVIARPQVWLTKKRWLGLALEGSFQAQQRGVTILDEAGQATPLFAKVSRIGVIPFVSPGGQGAFTRPHLQLIYLLTARDAAARSLYAPEDVFARRGVDHFIGITAEWWFGSTSYFRD
ncbi:MAG: carbohydrate porin [Nannocystaceae bacterium]